MKKKDSGLRVEYDFHRLKGGVKGKYEAQAFGDSGDRIKELRKKRPDVYKALKSSEPLACLAWNVIELRGEKGWSQQQLADKSGVAKRVIAYIESYSDGYNTSVNIIQKIALAFGVPFRRMFQEVDLTKV